MSPEKEAKVKIILNTAANRSEAQKMLQKENFMADDIIRIVQKYYRWVFGVENFKFY